MFIMLAVQLNVIEKRFFNAGHEKSLHDSYLNFRFLDCNERGRSYQICEGATIKKNHPTQCHN